MHPLTRTAIVAAAALLLAFGASVGCDETGDSGGGRGALCYFDDDCAAPLTCDDAPDVAFTVCTSDVLEGEICDSARPCAWIRDDRGLPLECTAGVCAFPPRAQPDAR